MLNIIWAGLIILSIIFAIGHDLNDKITNRYGNGIPVKVSYTESSDPGQIVIDYQGKQLEARILDNEIIIPIQDSLPEHWRLIAENQPGKSDTVLRAVINDHRLTDRQLSILFAEIHWLKLKAITQAAFDMAEFAVKLAIGLAGIMALWLGLMQVAESSGLIAIFVRLVHPLLGWLFPQVPANHPALGSISLNLAANILGLGNAATPLGIKAMQQLQTLNENKGQASDAMCMFLALNTSSVQLLPPVTLIALMGTGVSELLGAIILATLASTIAAIISVKLYIKFGSR